ncbi:glycosyltransferase family 1 protein [Lasiosphaeria miniovina]|uniref:Sterol 3-beta-glucosyltransferase n=1 Tax=Lasiosphaeria miniovina TaxID=1954250 RepID=A0AA40DU48_9PEZI|nr:glycosyltransferase family 1 protein [Lasiosphaeria miniovina]KAK0713467.1 glycosyltransferase family 1 protein [Lasiosphaeria miniovina]
MAPLQPTAAGSARLPSHSSPLASQPSQSRQPDPPLSAPTRSSIATSADEPTARRVSRKLQKKRRETGHTPTMELPERFKEDGDHPDGDEDVLQPQGYAGGMFMNMNQSIFGLIAAAGSQVDFTDRFEGHSSDEDEGEGVMAMTIAGHKRTPRQESLGSQGGPFPLAQTTILRKPNAPGTKAEGSRHRRKISESRLLRSVSGLARLSSKSKTSKSPKEIPTAAEEQIREPDQAPAATSDLAPSIEITRAEGRLAPVMSRMLEARAEMASRPSFDLDRLSGEQGRDAEVGNTGPTELAMKLKEIFEFDSPEEVIEEYPCWLLQHVLLQGYMYITARHIAFYAYLPKKANEVAKSGYLSKSGKRNPKYNRYWFRLKGDVLSYYRDPQNLYFPSGQIDLRYGISASVTDKEKDKDDVHFTVTTHHRTYNFKADSVQSAKEWVKSLQRVIFRSHNDGDSVKISLPIENVIDVEETQMLDFADTCKIRVIDNDETYAIDEYFFSFFSFGKEALNVLKILVEDSLAQTPGLNDLAQVAEAEELSSHETSSKRTSTSGSRERPQRPPNIRTSKLAEVVRATLTPLSPGHHSPSPRASGELTRSSFDAFRPFGRRSLDVSQIIGPRPDSPRRSFSDSRRSQSRNRLGDSRVRPEKQGSSDSYVQSLEDPSQASLSALIVSGSSEDQSASQILRGSDVFHSPTIRRSASQSRAAEEQDERGARPIIRHHTSGLVKYSPKHASTTGHTTDPGAGEHEGIPSTPTLQSITKMGGYPFQRANAIMGYLDRQSRRMSTLLATESMGYVEKVSGMWKGGKKHYDEPSGLKTDDEEIEDDPEERASSEARFQAHFALPETEKLQAAYFGYLMRVLPLYGKIYIGDRHFCFRSLLPGTRTKLILPFKDIENVDKEKGFRFGYSGLVVVIRGHEEIFFEFGKGEIRDDCSATVHQNLEATRYLRESSLLDQDEMDDAQAAVAERDALKEARGEEFAEHEVKLPRQNSGFSSEAPTILFDDPKASFLNFKPTKSMKVTCLTIGSRGDVQPYIALCKRLIQEGHRPRIATHAEFKDWIESHGIEFANVGGDPSELMRICIQNGTFTWAFLKEANSKFRGWLDELLASAWVACQGSDLLIESPSAMAGIHIAEALGIPYFRAFTMPWTRTRAYPHAFIMPGQKMGGAYNYVTYVMFDNVFWKAMAHQVNRWRNNTLHLPNTNLEKLQMNKVPFLYNFSSYVVPPPLDYSDWIRVTGYWFLDEGGDKWEPPKELKDFIEKARRDEKKIVYVGFGSIIVPDPIKMTQEVIDAVKKADVRCILSKGWSDRLDSPDANKDQTAGKGSSSDNTKVEPVLPPEIFQIKSAPHDWLFKQIDAAAHHGGSGTTGASLRAGIPTIIRPFFGDQFFFGTRVEDLGVGICLKKWGANSFSRALWEATHSERMIVKARVLGEQIRKENGVDTAIQSIYRDLEYATNLIKSKIGKNASRRDNAAAGGEAEADDDEAEEESWTFVGADAEAEDNVDPITKRAETEPKTPLVGSRSQSNRSLGGVTPRVA